MIVKIVQTIQNLSCPTLHSLHFNLSVFLAVSATQIKSATTGLISPKIKKEIKSQWIIKKEIRLTVSGYPK
jgi:hypothetical protein